MKAEDIEVIKANNIAVALGHGKDDGSAFLILSSKVAFDVAYQMKDAEAVNRVIVGLQKVYASLIKQSVGILETAPAQPYASVTDL